jgi:hypothetical protein
MADTIPVISSFRFLACSIPTHFDRILRRAFDRPRCDPRARESQRDRLRSAAARRTGRDRPCAASACRAREMRSTTRSRHRDLHPAADAMARPRPAFAAAPASSTAHRAPRVCAVRERTFDHDELTWRAAPPRISRGSGSRPLRVTTSPALQTMNRSCVREDARAIPAGSPREPLDDPESRAPQPLVYDLERRGKYQLALDAVKRGVHQISETRTSVSVVLVDNRCRRSGNDPSHCDTAAGGGAVVDPRSTRIASVQCRVTAGVSRYWRGSIARAARRAPYASELLDHPQGRRSPFHSPAVRSAHLPLTRQTRTRHGSLARSPAPEATRRGRDGSRVDRHRAGA